jgi:hypothetical protein
MTHLFARDAWSNFVKELHKAHRICGGTREDFPLRLKETVSNLIDEGVEVTA